jgi:hypothetical protein
MILVVTNRWKKAAQSEQQMATRRSANIGIPVGMMREPAQNCEFK